jgi:lycopene cyclase domain-containing protein
VTVKTLLTYPYLFLNVGTILFPFLLSFDKKVAFFRSWKALFPAIAISGAVVSIWEVFFTEWGVWSFNGDYLIGWYILGLPLEEWLFFLTVPYACVFIYACLRAYFPKWEGAKWGYYAGMAVTGISLLVGVLNTDKLYTAVTAFLLAIYMAALLFMKHHRYLDRFFQAWLVHLIPFFLINGVLTALPVVMYNDLENVGIRLGTVPLEDPFYSMLLLLMNVSIYEYLRTRRGARSASATPKSYV